MDQQIPYFGGQDSPAIMFFVYCWGKNKDGELSIGSQKFVSNPKPVRGLKSVQVAEISSGSQHSAVVTTDGKLWVCGSALHQKLGLEDQNQPNYPKLQPVLLLSHLVVKKVACGDYHTLCLMDNGEVYAWGGTLHKKLGQRAGRPASIQSLQNNFIVDIDCGDFHSAALTKNGEIYTWGGGGRDYNRGQLGHGHLFDVEMPEKVKFSNEVEVKQMACGGYHMMALDQYGQLWSWGQGMYGETGLGEFQDYSLPKKVSINFNQKSLIVDDLYLSLQPNDHMSYILDIKLGGHHSIILNNKGLVYTCGYAQYGQLGLKTKENHNKFSIVMGLLGKEVIMIAAGWNHSVVLTNTKDIYTCGHNAAGQLGVGDEESRTIFTHVQNLAGKNTSRIYAGGSHTWALIDYETPNILNYTPPSPIKEEPGGNHYLIKEVSSFDEKQEKFVEVIISEVDMYHRFVRIKQIYQNEPGFKVKLNEYIQLIQRDKNTKLVKIQSDAEVMEQQHISDVSYTILIIQSYSQQDYEQQIDVTVGKQTSIGQQIFKKLSTLKGNKYQWIMMAEKIFSQFQTKYFELQPISN